MIKRTHATLFFALVWAAGCGHNGSVPETPQSAVHEDQLQSGVVHGNFTEYALPSGAKPSDFTRGPYNTLWFHSPPGVNTASKVYRFNDSNGAVSTFSIPGPFFNWSSGITSTGKLVWYFVADSTTENDLYLVEIASSGGLSMFPAGSLSDEPIGQMMVGSDGKFWFPLCVEACGNNPNGDYVSSISTAGTGNDNVQLGNSFTATSVSPGPSGFVYATAVYTGTPPAPTHDSAVFVVSTSGTILHTYYAPHGSGPAGITDGSDHNLWITEPGINKIARMTTAGVFTQYALPTAGAGPAGIAAGQDGALWFTETNANKIGRITTAGSIREFSIPTAGSGASAILPCTTNCPPHGGVWFTETSANKIGKFVSPL